MSWSVGWDGTHARWRGYGVPAYCDAKGCTAKIDRGLGYQCECDKCLAADDPIAVTTFVCDAHTCADVDPADMPEHPEWIAHVSTDDSWSEWRAKYPERFARLVGSDRIEIEGTGA